MTRTNAAWPVSSILLLLFGAALVLMRLYFLLLRPSFLPEDLHYIGASQMQVEAGAPRLASWLMNVFRVLGGYISSTGLLVIHAGRDIVSRKRPGRCGRGARGGTRLDWYDDDRQFRDGFGFKGMLLGIALLWASSLGVFYLENLGGRE